MAPSGPEPYDSQSSDSWSDDPLSDREIINLARRVRRTADEELAEIEYETERAEQKRQDLTARSMQAMMEGERWLVTIGQRAVEGRVVHAGQNFTGLEDRTGNLHDVVHAAIAVIKITEVDPRQGRAPITLRPATFLARLLGLEQTREVELSGHRANWSLLGTIDLVNSEHLIFHERSGEVSIVPIDSVGYLGRTRDDQRQRRKQTHR